jgi:hypothetical protein
MGTQATIIAEKGKLKSFIIFIRNIFFKDLKLQIFLLNVEWINNFTMRHHFCHTQAMFNKGSLFYSHCDKTHAKSANLGFFAISNADHRKPQKSNPIKM